MAIAAEALAKGAGAAKGALPTAPAQGAGRSASRSQGGGGKGLSLPKLPKLGGSKAGGGVGERLVVALFAGVLVLEVMSTALGQSWSLKGLAQKINLGSLQYKPLFSGGSSAPATFNPMPSLPLGSVVQQAGSAVQAAAARAAAAADSLATAPTVGQPRPLPGRSSGMQVLP